MNGTRLDLSIASWVVGELVGRGPLGRVYEVTGRGGRDAVAKLVRKAPDADPELLFAEVDGVRNVVPVIDWGEYRAFWVLVMPRAELSLRDYLDTPQGFQTVGEVLAVLVDLATALVDLDGVRVHGDLKPENVLLLDGSWRLSDLGVGPYTASLPMPETPVQVPPASPYAAPEHWRGQQATSAADVYALGAMGVEMLRGAPPFLATVPHELRDEHLFSDSPLLGGIPAALETLLDECLFKSPGARPTPQELLERLTRMRSALDESEGGADDHPPKRAPAPVRRDSHATAARQGYARIAAALHDGIAAALPGIEDEPVNGRVRRLGWSVRLGLATLTLDECTVREATWGGWSAPAFSVAAWGAIRLRFDRRSYGYEGRSHSLWFGDVQEEDRFAWFETAFTLSGFTGRYPSVDPFHLDPGVRSAKAITAVAEHSVAWPFTEVDTDDTDGPDGLDELVTRWSGWLALAADARLTRPLTSEQRPGGVSWRRV